MLRFRRTRRGLAVANFTDRYAESCSIQRSSIAGEDCIWLGRDDPPDNGNGQPLARMHLDRRMVREILPVLAAFADDGMLPGETPAERRETFTVPRFVRPPS